METTKTGTLYLCATPIGNLDDVSVRMLNTLKEVDLIACEDTRHSLKLLNHFDISKPLTSYFEHNKKEKGEYLIAELKSGKNIALVTDAGTPAISDPGEDLVKMCIENSVKVVPIPGACALINALIISGQNTQRFSFEGFLSMNKKSRDEHLKEIANDTRTLIFHEAPHKLTRTLNDLYKYLGDRSISLVRELTKIHEDCVKTTISHAIEYYSTNYPKGEYVIVVAGKDINKIEEESRSAFENISLTDHVNMLIEQGIDKKEAYKQVAKARGLSKRDVYNEYLKTNGDETNDQ